MRVLVACEYSGVVRNAFLKRGHMAFSCDILPSESFCYPYHHFKSDVLDLFRMGWDLIIAHPPCTHLSASGARFWKEKQKDGRQQRAIDFFMKMVNAPCDRIAIENPVGVMSKVYRKPTQYIQPYQFGHPETKKTGLWLKNLLPLIPTKIVKPKFIIGKDGKRYSPIHYMSFSNQQHRSKIRSLTYHGVADAMATQWGANV